MVTRLFDWVPPKLILIILLSVWSYFLVNGTDHYDTIAADILPNLTFGEGAKFWSGTNHGIRLIRRQGTFVQFELEEKPRQIRLVRNIPNPQQYSHIRVTVDVYAQNLKPGNEWWQRGGIVLRSFDKQGKLLQFWPKRIGFLDGDTDWRTINTVLPISDSTAGLQLTIFLDGHAGILRFKNLHVDSVTPTAWYGLLLPATVIAWVCAGAWIILPLVAIHRRRVTTYLALLSFFAVLIGVLTPQPFLSEIPARVLAVGHFLITEATSDRQTVSTPKSDKPNSPTENGQRQPATAEETASADLLSAMLASDFSSSPELEEIADELSLAEIRSGIWSGRAHLTMHFVLGFFTMLAFSMQHWGRMLVYLGIFAAVAELLQVFVITRSLSLEDAALNIAGAAIGVGVAVSLAWAMQRLQWRPLGR